MAEIDPVTIKLIADVAKAQGDMRSALGSIDNSLQSTERRMTSVERLGFRMGEGLKAGFRTAGAAAAGLLAAFSIDAIVRATQAGLEYAASLGETATQLGVTTNALQEYRFAGTQAGASVEEVDQALGQLTRRIGEGAAGTRAQAAAFRQLGVSLRDTEGNIRATGDVIPLIAEGLRRIESPAERARILMDLFGRSGVKMGALLADGANGVNSLRNAAHELGIVLSEDQIANADRTADRLDALKQVLSANIAGVVANNSDAILGLANALGTVVVWAGNAINALQRFGQAQRIGNEIGRQRYLQGGGFGGFSVGSFGRNLATQRIRELEQQQRRLEGGYQGNAKQRTTALPAGGALPSASTGGGGSEARSGPSAAELAERRARAERQFMDQLGRLQVEELQTRADLSQSARARYALELGRLMQDRASFDRDLAADDGLSAARREQLTAQRDLVDINRRAVAEQQFNIDQATEAAQITADDLAARRELAQHQSDMADSASERLAAEDRLISLAAEEERARLELIIATRATASAEAEIAQRQLARLEAVTAQRREESARRNETPAQAFLREVNRSSGQMNEDLQRVEIEGLKSLGDGITDVITGAKSLGDVFSNVADQIISDLIRIAIQQAIVAPLANALFGGTGGGGGAIGGFFSSLFGRASGGYVNAGQTYRVNEGAGAGRAEFFQPTGSGKVIPLGQVNAMSAGGNQVGGQIALTVTLSGDLDARIDNRAAGVAIQVVQTAAPSIIQGATAETTRRLSRPGLGS